MNNYRELLLSKYEEIIEYNRGGISSGIIKFGKSTKFYSIPFPVIENDLFGTIEYPSDKSKTKYRRLLSATSNQQNKYFCAHNINRKELFNRQGYYEYAGSYFRKNIRDRNIIDIPCSDYKSTIGPVYTSINDQIQSHKESIYKILHEFCVNGLKFRFNESDNYSLEHIDELCVNQTYHFAFAYVCKMIYINIYRMICDNAIGFRSWSIIYTGTTFITDALAIAFLVLQLLGMEINQSVAEYKKNKICPHLSSITIGDVIKRSSELVDKLIIIPIQDYIAIGAYIVSYTKIEANVRTRIIMRIKMFTETFGMMFDDIKYLSMETLLGSLSIIHAATSVCKNDPHRDVIDAYDGTMSDKIKKYWYDNIESIEELSALLQQTFDDYRNIFQEQLIIRR